jgi:hypothetical protein
MFTLSIEDQPGSSFRHPFHLGTIEQVARDCAERAYFDRVYSGQPVVTVALIRDRKLFDCFDGFTWSSDLVGHLSDLEF